METRTNRNLKFDTGEIVFGISIRVDGGHKYCKYPVGYQSFKTLGEAVQAKENVLQILSNGGSIVYPSGVSKGVNATEPVKIKNI